MREILAEELQVLNLGRQGENLASAVVFDLSGWQAEFGEGRAELLVRRSGECAPYPAAVEVSGNAARWVLTAADTAVPGGYGECELRYYAGEALLKSRVWRTYVEPALEPSEGGAGPPDPAKSWVDQVLSAGERVERAALAAAKPPYPDGETGTWWVWDAEAGEYRDSGEGFSGGFETASAEEVRQMLAEVFGD